MAKIKSKSINKSVGLLIKSLRLEKDLSQESLADLSGLDRTYISGVERNQRNLTIKTLSKIILHLVESESEFFRLLAKELGNE